MQELSSKMQGKQRQQIQWRRAKAMELCSKGHSQVEIAKILQITESTISRDIDYLRSQSKQKIRRYIDETLPEEYESHVCFRNPVRNIYRNRLYTKLGYRM
jgi:DNA-binding transcriptional regulator LsrR (DeoR family)